MTDEPSKQKQDADEDRDPKNVKEEGYTADEIGAESSYNDSTEVAQQIRRGDEAEGDPDNRDAVGATTSANDDRKPVPRHQDTADDVSDKNPNTKEN